MFRHTTAASCLMSVGEEQFTLDERGVLRPEPSPVLAARLRAHPAFVEETVSVVTYPDEAPEPAPEPVPVAEEQPGDAPPAPDEAPEVTPETTTPKPRASRGRR